MLRIASPTEGTTLMETKLKIQHLQYPFYHTIIYNCFEKSTLKSIISELQGFKKPAQHYVDEHHKSLGRTFNTEPFCLDNIYTNKRNKSPILQATQRTLDLKLDEHGASNPFLNYLPMTNKDTTFIQRYRAGSSYPNHHDGSVLPFLYLIKVKEHTGGNLIFSKYNYTPHTPHNSCLIFPPYEIHGVSEVFSKTKDPVRFSINRRYYINL